jgi:hypothetical protein
MSAKAVLSGEAVMQKQLGRCAGLISLVAAALFSVSGVATAATTFDYSYTFDLGVTLSGSFDGVAVGDLIVDVYDVTAYIDGIPFHGNGDLTEYSYDSAHGQTEPNDYVLGGAYFSFDGLENNFLFVDGTNTEGGYTNGFFGLTGAATNPPGAPAEIGYTDYNVSIDGYLSLGDFPPNSSWRVTAVPEPPSFLLVSAPLLLLAGLATCREQSASRNQAFGSSDKPSA